MCSGRFSCSILLLVLYYISRIRLFLCQGLTAGHVTTQPMPMHFHMLILGRIVEWMTEVFPATISNTGRLPILEVLTEVTMNMKRITHKVSIKCLLQFLLRHSKFPQSHNFTWYRGKCRKCEQREQCSSVSCNISITFPSLLKKKNHKISS